jgi:hypothetical protein
MSLFETLLAQLLKLSAAAPIEKGLEWPVSERT